MSRFKNNTYTKKGFSELLYIPLVSSCVHSDLFFVELRGRVTLGIDSKRMWQMESGVLSPHPTTQALWTSAPLQGKQKNNSCICDKWYFLLPYTCFLLHFFDSKLPLIISLTCELVNSFSEHCWIKWVKTLVLGSRKKYFWGNA